MNSFCRVLHVASTIDPYGSSRQLQLLVENLSKSAKENEVLALHTLGDTYQKIASEGTPVSQLHQRWKVDPIAAARLAYQLRRRNVDLLHCWGLTALIYTCLVLPWQHRLPLVVTLTNHLPNWPFSRFLLKWLIAQVQSVVVSNQAMYLQCVERGISPEKLLLIPSGVLLPNSPSQTREEFLAANNLPEEARLIAVVGPLLVHKRVDDAIWCFELVRVLYNNSFLLVIGDGPHRRRLERFARLVCVPGAVRFLGLRADVEEILPFIDLFWQRSEWEAGPSAVLEAMAARIPVVATDIGPHARFIVHGQTGYLSPVGNRADCTRLTDQLFSDLGQSRQIGNAARAYVGQHFSVEKMANTYQRLYEQAISTFPRSVPDTRIGVVK